ncbi:MAG: hypothetical protein ACKV2U_24525 [Bryobacteraceae bacterium]
MRVAIIGCGPIGRKRARALAGATRAAGDSRELRTACLRLARGTQAHVTVDGPIRRNRAKALAGVTPAVRNSRELRLALGIQSQVTADGPMGWKLAKALAGLTPAVGDSREVRTACQRLARSVKAHVTAGGVTPAAKFPGVRATAEGLEIACA